MASAAHSNPVVVGLNYLTFAPLAQTTVEVVYVRYLGTLASPSALPLVEHHLSS